MNIFPSQAQAIASFLTERSFTGYIFDPNDHDESVHQLHDLSPDWSTFSFKPSVSNRVINGGTCFRHGAGSNMFNAIVTGPIRNGEDRRHVVNGLKACVDGALVIVCGGDQFPHPPEELESLPIEWNLTTSMGVMYGSYIKP